MLDADKIRHKGLRLLFVEGSPKKLNQDHVPRLQRMLAALNVATAPEELDIPGYRWHVLKGDRKGAYSLRVSANWRLIFRWSEEGPYDVDLEDYHGD